jgi:predicted esterase
MSQGILKSRPSTFTSTTSRTTSSGLYGLPSLESKRSGLLYIPKSYKDSEPASLILMLHGAGCEAKHGIDPLINYADENNFILVAPKSKESTWDCIRHKKYGEDVTYIDKVLSYLFESFNIGPDITVQGFSDGATYALSLGLANRDLFTSIMAFSPGYIFFPSGTSLDTLGVGATPRIYFSHGTHDQVLHVDYCSRRIAKNFKRSGFDHHYLEFIGGHTITEKCIDEALKYCRQKPKEIIKEVIVVKEITKKVKVSEDE